MRSQAQHRGFEPLGCTRRQARGWQWALGGLGLDACARGAQGGRGQGVLKKKTTYRNGVLSSLTALSPRALHFQRPWFNSPPSRDPLPSLAKPVLTQPALPPPSRALFATACQPALFSPSRLAPLGHHCKDRPANRATMHARCELQCVSHLIAGSLRASID